MIEINLVPDVKQELLKAHRIRNTVVTGAIFIGVASLSVVAVLAFYIYGVQSVRSSIADNTIASEYKKLNSVKDLSSSLTIQNQLMKVTNLNNEKKIDSRIFDVLLAIIPPKPNDIKISVLQVDSTDNSVTIEGQSNQSYAALEVFKKTIEGAKVKFNTSDDKEYQTISLTDSISISDTSYGQDSTGDKVLMFKLRFTYRPELLSPMSKNLTTKVNTSGNVTDSYLGVPFIDRAKNITEGN